MQKKLVKPLAPWLLGGYLLLIATLSLMPNPPQPPAPLAWDKFEHACGYALLAFLACLALPDRMSRPGKLWLAGGAAFGFGFLIEGLQGLLPLGRYFEFFDLVANLVGVLVGLGAVSLQMRTGRQDRGHEDG